MDNIKNMQFENITLLISLIVGLIFALFSILIWIYAKKSTLKIIKQNYPEETIKCSLQLPLWIILFSQFCIGGFIGAYMLPFLLFQNVYRIKMVTINSLPYYGLLTVISVIFWVALGTCNIVLTNKRIVTYSLFKFLNFLRYYNILICNIKKIERKKEDIIIITNENINFDLGKLPGRYTFYKIVTSLIKSERI